MAMYIVARNGFELSEDGLKAIYELHTQLVDYEDWKNEKIMNGVIKEKEND